MFPSLFGEKKRAEKRNQGEVVRLQSVFLESRRESAVSLADCQNSALSWISPHFVLYWERFTIRVISLTVFEFSSF